MDDTDRLIAKARLEAADWQANHFNPNASSGTGFTPVYLFSTKHGFHILGLDNSPSTLDLVSQARRTNQDLCDPMLTALALHEALEALNDADDSQNIEAGKAAYFYSRATKTWRLLEEHVKTQPGMKPHFFAVQYHASGFMRPVAMLDERDIIPAPEALEFVVSVLANDRLEHPEYFEPAQA